MPTFIRIFTGVIVVGGVAGTVWAPNPIGAFYIGAATLTLVFLGLVLAAHLEDT